jgi:hypothetical protein
MLVQYIIRRGQSLYLHKASTKTGRKKYFFSMKREGDQADSIPDGFEIYENPNSQVFLRKKQPRLITDEEAALVDEGMKKFSDVECYIIDIKKHIITVYTSDQGVDRWSDIFGALSQSRAKEMFSRFASYSPMLQFVLEDKERRLFITRRYCFLGSVDDWIEISQADTIGNLVREYLKHLGQDSFFELF